MKNAKLSILKMKIGNTLKHLRGQHNQLDHAWNRGMGGGGSSGLYGPGYMNTQQFLELKASLQAQIAAGSITQEEGEATWTAVQRIHNEDYDNRKRTEQELSRRESTVETLANRRRNRTANQKRPFSAQDIMMTAENSTLANLQSYTGTELINNWNNIKTNIDDITEEENNAFDAKIEVDGSEQYLWTKDEGRIKAISLLGDFLATAISERNAAALRYPADAVDRFLNDNEQRYLPETHLPTLTRNITDILNDLEGYTRRTGKSPSKVLEELRKNIDKFVDNYKKAQEFDWNPSDEELENMNTPERYNPQIAAALQVIARMRYLGSNEQMQEHINDALRGAEALKQVLQPSVLFSIYDAASTVQVPNPLSELQSGQIVDFNNVREIAYDSWRTRQPLTVDNVIGRLAVQLLYRNHNSTNGMDGNATDFLWRQAAADPSFVDVTSRTQWRESLTLGPTQAFGRALVDPNTWMPYLQNESNRDNFKTKLRDKFHDGLMQRLGITSTNDYQFFRYYPTDEQKEIIKSYYGEFLDTYYASLQQYTQYNDEDVDKELNYITNFFDDYTFQRSYAGSLSLQEKIEAHREAAQRYGVSRYAQTLISELETKEQEQQILNMPFSERLPMQLRVAQQRLDAANQSGQSWQTIMEAERAVDDIAWSMMLRDENLNTNFEYEEQEIEARLQRQVNMYESTRESLQDDYDTAQETRRQDVDEQRQNALSMSDPDDLASWARSYIASARLDGNSDEYIGRTIQRELAEIRDYYPELDTDPAEQAAASELSDFKIDDKNNIDWDSFIERQNEAWDGREPKVISADSIVDVDDTVFGSPAYAYGNPLSNPLTDEDLMPPDNPDEVPIFNPRSARFGAREVIESKDANPQSIFGKYGDAQRRQLTEALTALGYSEETIKTILGNLNDQLIPAPRKDTPTAQIYAGSDEVRVSIYSNYGDGGSNDPITSSSTVDITFTRDPSKTVASLYVGLMKIPEYVGPIPADPNEPRPANKFKGAAGPLLMRAADQLRRITYPLGSSTAYLKANAVNIAQKVADQNSGPSTWPVLGGTASVRVTDKLINRLMNMGYSKDFVSQLMSNKNNVVPSTLFFLNTPPYIFILDRKANDGSYIKVKSSPQTLWNEIYYTKCVDTSFAVKVNVASPNDPGRLYNPFIPGSRKKEWTNLSRIKSTISYFNHLRKRK